MHSADGARVNTQIPWIHDIGFPSSSIPSCQTSHRSHHSPCQATANLANPLHKKRRKKLSFLSHIENRGEYSYSLPFTMKIQIINCVSKLNGNNSSMDYGYQNKLLTPYTLTITKQKMQNKNISLLQATLLLFLNIFVVV